MSAAGGRPGAAIGVACEVLSIGDELVHGSLLDTNARWLAAELEAHGAALRRFTVVGDDEDDVRAAMAEACSRAEIVVCTGGIGPTLDDRTRIAAAQLAGGPLWFDEASWQHIQRFLRRRRRPVPESNRRQAEFPPGAAVLGNALGTAPGFRVRLQRAELFALPGVPREMQQMVQDHVVPFLLARAGLRPLRQHLLAVLGPSEAQLGEVLAPHMQRDREPTVGITASAGLLTVRIVARGDSAAAAAALCERTAGELRPLLGEWRIAEGEGALHEIAGERLLAHGVQLALAESCTGGLCAAKLTEVPGISAVFRGGVVGYSDDAKVAALGVDGELIRRHGAVSEEVAAAMAEGVARRFCAGLGVSVSGIAGPGGGSAEKPVGTVCFGRSWQGRAEGYTLRIPDLGRAFVRDRAALEVFAAILRLLPAGEG